MLLTLQILSVLGLVVWLLRGNLGNEWGDTTALARMGLGIHGWDGIDSWMGWVGWELFMGGF